MNQSHATAHKKPHADTRVDDLLTFAIEEGADILITPDILPDGATRRPRPLLVISAPAAQKQGGVSLPPSLRNGKGRARPKKKESQ